MTEQGHTNRRMLVAAVTVLGAIAAAFLVIWGFADDPRWWQLAIVAMIAAVGPGSQLLLEPPRPDRAAVWSAIVIAVGQGIVDIPQTRVLSGVGLAALGVATSIFLKRRRQLIAGAIYAIALLLVSLWWDPDDGLSFGLGLAVGFGFMLWVQIELQQAYRRNRRIRERFDQLVSQSFIPILEFDFSPIMGELGRLAAEFGDDVEARLGSDKPLLDRLLSSVTVTDLNDAAASALGVEGVDLPIPATEGVDDGNVEAAAEWLAALATGRRQWDGVVFFRGRDGGGQWYQIRHIVPGDGEPDYSRTILTGMNITALKEAQAELRTLDGAKNEFIATIAHEMRTPLAGVIGFASELAESLGDHEPEVIQEMAAHISRQSRELAYILDDLMAVGSADIPSMKIALSEFDPVALVNDVIEDLGVGIRINGVEKPVLALGDPFRVSQIVRNLLTNAARYGGPSKRIEFSALSNTVRVSVIDDGLGLTAERVAEIFGRRGGIDRSDVVGSMGLGLNVSQLLAGLMGAELTYERLGDETVFSLDLQRVDASDRTPAET